MPAMQYPDGTPEDSQWDWYIPVPAAWLGYAPDKIMRYAQYLLDFYDITNNGAPAELSATQRDGDWYFLVKSDVDPATVVDMNNLPPVPKSAKEIRIERLTAAQTLLTAGTPLTNAQMQEAVKHLIDAELERAR